MDRPERSAFEFKRRQDHHYNSSCVPLFHQLPLPEFASNLISKTEILLRMPWHQVWRHAPPASASAKNDAIGEIGGPSKTF